MMKMWNNAFIAVLSLSFLTAGSHTFAAQSVSEDFNTDGDAGVLVNTGGSNSFSVSGGVINFTGGGDAGRAYVGTPDADYATTSFVAEIDVTLDGNDNSSSLFFGLGVGDYLPGNDNGFDQPTVGPSIFIGLRDRNDNAMYVSDFDSTADGSSIGPGGNDPLMQPGSHRVRMVNDAIAQELTFFIDIGKTGSFAQLLTTNTNPSSNGVFDTSDNGFDNTNARIFFGASNNQSFDNFTVTVIPEPSSIALATSAALVGLLSKRRRQ